MTMMTMVMMVMRDSYQAVFLSMTETARRRTERMQEETRSTGSLVMTRVVCVCWLCVFSYSAVSIKRNCDYIILLLAEIT